MKKKMKIQKGEVVLRNKSHQLTIEKCMMENDVLVKPKTQAQFDEVLVRLFVRHPCPFNVVDCEDFTILCTHEVMSRHTLVRKIDTKCEEMKLKLIQILKDVLYLSICADLWGKGV